MKRVLVINFFPAFFPPTSGGELRYYNMYSHLSAYYDVTLLSPTYGDHTMELITHSGTFREYRVPKNNIFDELHYEIDNLQIGSEISALVCALSSEHLNAYHEKYLELYDNCDIIIHESPYMLRYDLFFGVDDKLRIYNSYNYESDLMAQIWSGPFAKRYLELIHNLEGELVRKCDLVFTTCEEDRMRFITDFSVDKEKVKLAPNGINPDEYLMRDSYHSFNEKSAMFIGSGHPPNIEAVEFIINHMADQCKNITFNIAGSCCNKIKAAEKPNVHILGIVSQKEKEELFMKSHCAINPMFSGSGTNLKTLEFFSSGIPLLSTEVGVRGLGVLSGEHFFQANIESFPQELDALMNESLAKKTKIAAAGRDYVNSHFSWRKITKNVYQEIEKLEPKVHVTTILILNDYSAAKPRAGGEIRINNLYSNISYRYKVISVCLNDEDRIVQSYITSRFLEISVPKTREHLAEQKRINDRFWVSATDIITSYMCKKNQFLTMLVARITNFTDSIVLSHPFMAGMLCKKINVPVIYESHNDEVELKKSILQGHPDYWTLIKKTQEAVQCAIEYSVIIITCSKEDLYPEFNKPIFVVENGVKIPILDKQIDLNPIKSQMDEHPVVLFIGSGHTPNVEAAEFIINTLAMELPYIYFMIVGSVCNAFDNQSLPNNILLMGVVSEEIKEGLMRIADIAINPMCTGSGSNLKLADYFSAQLPTVTTTLGMRGYEITHGIHALVCELNDFSKAIKQLSTDTDMANAISKNAFRYVFNKLDWRTLARCYVDILDTHIFNRKKKNILVITYRINDPDKGGAEVFLGNVLRRINIENLGYVDIVTLNIGNISSYKHFSIQYDYDSDVYQNIYQDKQIYKFNVDMPSTDIIDRNCRTLYRLWNEESRRISLLFISKYTYPLLLGGWYYPEKSENGVCVWSCPEALIYCMGMEAITIKGYSNIKQKLSLKQAEKLQKERLVDGAFSITCELDSSITVLEIHTSIFSADDDVRELGVCVREITYKINQETHLLDLNTDYKSFIIEHDIDGYVDALIDNAKTRNESYDQLFLDTRGPNSSELELWLDENINRYDAALIHNTPFATSVIGVKYAQKHNVNYIALPHYHFDDAFYHWNMYYQLFKQASVIITSPLISEKLFYQKISSDNHLHLPGGGIDQNEYLSIDSSEFKSLYDSQIPYFLVLGRKSTAKCYMDIISAVEEMNKVYRRANLVMIGPDEDGVDLTGRDVIYLGRQPREVVLGALANCIALVNMSDSESFGIVILEAWAVKKPVIVNQKCFAFNELVKNDINGLVCNRNEILSSLCRLYEDSVICSSMGDMGYQLLQRGYTWEKITEKILATIDYVQRAKE